VNDLHNRLAALSPEQRARLLERVRKERPTSAEASTSAKATVDKTAGRPAGDVTPIPAADRTQPLPLSFAQRRIWFLERLEGRSAAYNMPAAFRLQGDLDANAVTAALSEISRRHEVLRTRLVEIDAEPVQVIDAPADDRGSRCRTMSLDGVAGQKQDDALRVAQNDALRERLRAEAGYVFDLAAEHPLRVLLIRLAPAEHVLVVTLHHVASDGWSTGVLIREFAALYNSQRAGAVSPLAPLPVQYADFAQWQRGQLEDAAVTEPHLAHWRTALADAPGVINLPVDGRRDTPAGEGSAVYFSIDAETADAVNALARRTDASAYMVLLSAFMALLHRWSGEFDLTVGSPIANRPRKELEGLIGFFVNTLALRVDLTGDPDFLGLISRVRTTALAGYAHADLPFELVVEKLNPERRLNRAPFFQVMFAMQSGELADVALDGLRIEAVPVSTGAARLDLTLSIQETGDGFAGCLEFATALFRPETAQRFAEHFRNLIAAAVREPATALSRLDYLGDGERHRLLIEWNRTDMPSRPRGLHQLVEEQAARTPDAVALRWNGTAWTYAQLMARADHAARLLQQKGVGVETLVGVCMSRTPDMIAALLGVLRAGGAYVALDPAYPVARTEYVLDHSGATIVLRDGALDEAVADKPEGLSPQGLFPQVTPSNLAYVLYTSGSTGQPKGVAIEHRSPAALIAWAQSVWSPAELRGVLAGTSICFDLSVFEIFLPLSVGGTVILANNVLELPNLVDRDHVTLINTVPSAIDALLHQRAIPAGVRVVNLAGEPLTTELADRIYDVPTIEKVYDLYGPSEDTTYSTFILRRRGDAPSIGRPIANTRLYILDRNMQPVPVGVPGEIYLGGQGLARGYLGRPDLTEERFVPSPFTGIDRLYRTGDRAQFRDDGNVEFLGRFDHQVKLRGFRIELGEIEAVARAFPNVGQCVVTVEESQAGNQRLVAYVSHPDGAETGAALHAHLRASLPEYMVPPVLVILEQLPLTPNGKIDRKALPRPDQAASTEDQSPLTVAEARLAALWQTLLATNSLIASDDFFALGGHSLLAAKLGARIRDEFGVDLPLRAIFEHTRLRDQAAAITRLPAAAGPIPVVERESRLPLSFAQERLWFLDQLEPGNPAYNMAGAIRLTGTARLDALRQAFDQVVDRHESLRTVFPTIDGRGFATPATVRPSLVEIDTPGDLDAWLRDEQSRSFNLATGPLIRAAAIRTAADQIVLAVTMHHIVSDGWSIDVFLDELCRAYTAALEGRAAQLPKLAVQYVDFAAWQRQRFAAGLLAPQLEFWRDALAGAPTLLELPTDRPRPEAQSYQGAVHSISIDSTLATQVVDRARESGVTSFMTLLAAFGMALNRWSGQDDMVIGFPAAGRSRRELEPLIGMFVNTVPIRLQIAEGATFASLLAQVKTRTVDALSNQDVPFEKLVDELGVERSLSWSPVFQVMFISQQARPAPALPAGLQVETIPGAETGTTKFDLTLAIAEREDGLVVSLEYDRALFDAETIERFANDYAAVLKNGLAAPEAVLEGSGKVLGGPRTSPNLPNLPEPPRTARNLPELVAPATPAEQALADIWRQVLRLDRISVTDNFFEVGGDSIVSIQVIAQLRDKGWNVDPRRIFRHQTIRALAAVAEPVGAATAVVEEASGPLPLTPMQQLFFDLNPPSPNHFNQSLLVTVAPDVAAAELQSALVETQRVHPVLRSRFQSGGNGWQQVVQPTPNVVVERRVAGTSQVEGICQAAQRSLDIANGPVFRAVLIDCGAAGLRLFLVAHHLVVDAVSWRVILADIETAYAQARRGVSPSLPGELCGPATHRELVRAWHADAGAAETDYWEGVTAGVSPLFAPAVSSSAPSRARTIVTTLAEDETAPLLGPAHRAYNTTTGDLLLAAYAKALAAVAGRDTVLVDVEGHGRDALPAADLSRSVGWFTTLYPIRVAQVGTSDASTLIRGVKEANRSVPNGGLGFGLSRQSSTGGTAPLTDVSFNFLGQTGASLGDGLLRSLAPESAGDPVAADLPRRYRVELNASIVEGRLVAQYGFDAAVVPEARIREVADRVTATLRDLVEHCLGVEGQRYTPSDFAAGPIEQQDLDALLSDLDLSGLSEA
jgi:amino acid adenylation domain-containing protein/non-ribosomal peptide synthase protein (TIGR01720 family)